MTILKIYHKYRSKKKQTWQLLDSEKVTYGDRCPKGYDKLDLLGK